MPSFKIRRLFRGTGGVRSGGATNYSDFNTAGRLTMAGTARVYKDLWLPATVWYGQEPNQFANAFNATLTSAGSTPTVLPYSVPAGEAAASPILVPTLAASTAADTDARAVTAFLAPTEAASSGSVQCHLYYTTKLAMATAGSMQVWRLHYNYWGSGGSAVGGSSGSILYGASMATTGSGKLEVQDLGDIPSFQVSTSPFVAMQLTLENSSASGMAGSPEEQIFGLRLRYIAEYLGVQVS